MVVEGDLKEETGLLASEGRDQGCKPSLPRLQVIRWGVGETVCSRKFTTRSVAESVS